MVSVDGCSPAPSDALVAYVRDNDAAGRGVACPGVTLRWSPQTMRLVSRVALTVQGMNTPCAANDAAVRAESQQCK